MIEKILYNEQEGAWFDYDLDTHKQTNEFYASATTPIYTDCHGFTDNEREEKIIKLVQYGKVGIMRVGAIDICPVYKWMVRRVSVICVFALFIVHMKREFCLKDILQP